MGPGEDGGAAGLGVEHRASTEEHFFSVSLTRLLDDLQRARGGHGDLDDLYAPGLDRIRSLEQLIAALRPHDGDHAGLLNDLQGNIFAHRRSLIQALRSRRP